MGNKKEFLLVRNVDAESKKKALFVLSCKGKNLSTAVREMVENLAQEFDDMRKEKTNENCK